MARSHCTAKDLEIINEALRAAAHGPFFPDWEFATLFGVERRALRRIQMLWPEIDERDESATSAITNVLTNLQGYPLGDDELARWDEYLSVPRSQLSEIIDRWKR